MSGQDDLPQPHPHRSGGSHAAPPPAHTVPAPPPQQPVSPQQTPPANAMAPYSPAQQAGAPPQPMVAPKNPILYALASFLITGLGSLLLGKTTRGLVFFAVAVIGGGLVALMSFIPFVGWIIALLILPFLFANWIWSMVHAYGTAQQWNRDHGVVS